MSDSFTLNMKEDSNAAFALKGFTITEKQDLESSTLYASVVINIEEIEKYIAEKYPEAADIEPRTGFDSSTHEAFVTWSSFK